MARVDLSMTVKVATAHKLTRSYVRRTAELILNGAKRLVPRGDHMSGSGQRQRGQQLGPSLKITSRVLADSITERIGSTKNYAATVHQGSSAHIIRGKGKMLKFTWERGRLLNIAAATGRISGRRAPRARNGFFYFVQVRHPGNKRPVRYLTTPLHLFGRARGFRTSSTPVSRSRLP